MIKGGKNDVNNKKFERILITNTEKTPVERKRTRSNTICTEDNFLQDEIGNWIWGNNRKNVS